MGQQLVFWFPDGFFLLAKVQRWTVRWGFFLSYKKAGMCVVGGRVGAGVGIFLFILFFSAAYPDTPTYLGRGK